MIRLSILAVFLNAMSAFAAPIELEGTIGPYEIEAELERAGDGNRLLGRYRYAGRDSWIDLTGEAFAQDAALLEEQVNGEVTGTFFLEPTGAGFGGFWVNETSDFTVNLAPKTGSVADLLVPDAAVDVTESLTGRYAVGHYWVNDTFAPNYEIGFNGGDVNVVELAPNIILVRFDFVVGPTYHFAFSQGLASLVEGQVYVHDAVLFEDGTPCRLVFRFTGTELSIEDTNSRFSCGFGARAHANFDLIKVSDTAEFDGSW